jgi:hypothetical protein
MVDLVSLVLDNEREDDICFVLGSSGSFFSVMDAAKYNVDQQKRFNGNKVFDYSVTIRGMVFRDVNKAVERVLKVISNNGIGQYTTGETSAERKMLKMHLSLVIDEASNFFEVKDNVKVLYRALKLSVAESVWLIISGTSLTAENFNPRTEARKYRMIPWKKDDIEAVRQPTLFINSRLRHEFFVQSTYSKLFDKKFSCSLVPAG